MAPGPSEASGASSPPLARAGPELGAFKGHPGGVWCVSPTANLCYHLAKGRPLCSPIPTSLPPSPLPYPHQTLPASPPCPGRSSLLRLPIHVKAKCSTKIDTKIEFWDHRPRLAINITAMKCLKIKAALSVHTVPPRPPLTDNIAARPVLPQQGVNMPVFSIF